MSAPRSILIAVIFAVVLSVGIVASLLFVVQGGFGGGSGEFDRAIFRMGLPWSAIPWPSLVTRNDFVWLIGLPLVLNCLAVFVLATMLKNRAA